jgi:hypothetical protein
MFEVFKMATRKLSSLCTQMPAVPQQSCPIIIYSLRHKISCSPAIVVIINPENHYQLKYSEIPVGKPDSTITMEPAKRDCVAPAGSAQ